MTAAEREAQQVRMLIRRTNYPGGRKARSAERRLHAIMLPLQRILLDGVAAAPGFDAFFTAFVVRPAGLASTERGE